MTSISTLYQYFQANPVVSTDSRKITSGCIFFALKGGNFNGNLYAEKAIEAGAAYAVIDEIAYQKDDRFLLVADVLKCLQQLANYHRLQFEIPILAITGSNGKTTTKELLSGVLNSYYRTHFTKGNFNNHIGVPLTLLAMPTDTEIAIIEMGANHPGEIDELCQIAEPTHGLITNIGKAHLDGFGGLEGVKQTKSELYRFLIQQEGFAFVNKEEAFLSDLAQNNQCIYYQSAAETELQKSPYQFTFLGADPYVSLAFLSEEGNLIRLTSQLIGTYNFNNIMTAVAVGKYFKVPSQLIQKAIENYQPTNNRSQIVKKDSNTYILDAYNANPTSMRAALDNFEQMQAPHKIAILGDMLELGKYSLSEHQIMLDYAHSKTLNQVISVGSEFEQVPTNHLHFATANELKVWLDNQNFKNHLFLIKGSRGIRLESIL